MPLYEYYCQSCDGVYEAMRPMREASRSVPCPQCNRDGQRMMSSFSAFTFRDGLPRRIPDKGTYWHWDHEVKRPATEGRGGLPWHPEVPGEPDPPPTKRDIEAKQEKQVAGKIEERRRKRDIKPIEPLKPRTYLTPHGRTDVRPGL